MAKAKKARSTEEESGFSEVMKRFKAHPFIFGGTVILLVFIIIAFVFVPTMPGIQQEGEEMVFGYYNGKPITQNTYFRNALYETAQMAGFDLQGDYSTNSNTAFQVWYQAFVRTLVHMAVLDEMKTAGYTAPPTEIDRQVAANPDFQEDGRFSVVKYNSYDKNQLLSLWRNTEESYTTGKYYNDYMGLKVSTAEKQFIGDMAYPERSFELVSFPRSAYPDSELAAFAQGHADLFKTVHLSRITIAGEKEAVQLLESIKNGTTAFEDAARNHSTDMDKEKGGDMGIRLAYEIFTELQEESDRSAVTSLRQGEYSAVLKAPGDVWVIFRAEENPYNGDLASEESLTKVRSYMNSFEGGRIENWLIALTEELMAEAKEQNKSLSVYVAELKAEQNPLFVNRARVLENAVTSTFGPISLNYGNMGGAGADRGLMLFTNTINIETNPELSSAALSEVFWRTAFSIPLNTPSSPFTLGDTITVLTAVGETAGDADSIENIANFYTWGWMYNAIGMDVNAVYMESDKFENHFYEAVMPMMFGFPMGQ
jgi:hypothetical protein